VTRALSAGDVVTIETPGGGGFGRPTAQPRREAGRR
jgi:N-methylhydantoinase B/oxoprolinase/acetone carboxylase alpha subunit